jgi:hypothetical protein
VNNAFSVNSGHTVVVNSGGIALSSQGNSSVSYTDHSVKNTVTVGDDRIYTNKDGSTTTEKYGTIVTGRMYVDGDLTVNGFITSANPSSVSGIAVNNSGLSVDGVNNTVRVVAAGTPTGSGARAELVLKEESAVVTVTNPVTRETHGLFVNTQSTTLTGGTRSTSLTLNDNGAAFRNEITRGPARVTGVDDGRSRYDAVNYGQLQKAYSGVASVAALAAVPGPVPGKKFSLGVGAGTYMDERAVAMAFTADVKDFIRIKSGFAFGRDQATVNAGISLSW